MDDAIETLTGVPTRSSMERAARRSTNGRPSTMPTTPTTTRMMARKINARTRRRRMDTLSGGGSELAELLFGIVLPQPAAVIPRTARNLDRGSRRDRLLAPGAVAECRAYCVLEGMGVGEVLACDLQRLVGAERSPMAGRDLLGRVVLERVGQCCERGTVRSRRDVDERKLDDRGVIADAQQPGLANAVRRSAPGVAGGRHRLDGEGADLQCLP